MMKVTVSQLSIYPVKSCRGININTAYVDGFGIKNDRRWMVVDLKGTMLTQRQLSEMCLIKVVLTDVGLVLEKAGLDKIVVAIPATKNKVSVKVWSDHCQAYDAGDAVAEWLSKGLLEKCRLVYFPDDEFRQVDLMYANKGEHTAFSDGFPLLLISEASLNDLNSRLDSPITMERFRPNIIVTGCDAFAEDGWAEIRVGEIIYRVVKPCSRCVIPNISIETAQREIEPIKTLSSYRMRENKIFFGQNLIANGVGDISVGMELNIIK